MSKHVLIVVDMQNDFVTGPLGSDDAKKIVPNIVKKIEEYKKNNDVVLFTKDTHDKEFYSSTLEGKKLPVPHCLKDTEGWDIIPELKKFIDSQSQVVEKFTFGYNPISDGWSEIFHKNGAFVDRADEMKLDPQSDPNNEVYRTIDNEFTIELCGVCTDICVVSNALIIRALYPNTKISVDMSCCAGTNTLNHIAAITVMKSCQIDII